MELLEPGTLRRSQPHVLSLAARKELEEDPLQASGGALWRETTPIPLLSPIHASSDFLHLPQVQQTLTNDFITSPDGKKSLNSRFRLVNFRPDTPEKFFSVSVRTISADWQAGQ